MLALLVITGMTACTSVVINRIYDLSSPIPMPLGSTKPLEINAKYNFTRQTTWNDLKPCGAFFEEDVEFLKALECTDKSIREVEKIQVKNDVNIPRCFVITTNSKDVYYNTELAGNFLHNFDLMSLTSEYIMGFYDDRDQTIYLVENLDIRGLYRHEVQHYLLDVAYEGIDRGHTSSVWNRCEPRYHTPTERQILINRALEVKEES